MAHHILAVFKTAQAANTAVDRLIENGISQTAISIMVGEGFRSEHLGVKAGNKGAEGAATGATIGGVLGAIAAGLTATGAVVATGGGVLVAGPIAAALAGAGAGGAAGGVLGGLLGLGVPEQRIKAYETAVSNNGGMVVGVEVTDRNKYEVKQILKNAGGEAVSEE